MSNFSSHRKSTSSSARRTPTTSSTKASYKSSGQREMSRSCGNLLVSIPNHLVTSQHDVPAECLSSLSQAHVLVEPQASDHVYARLSLLILQRHCSCGNELICSNNWFGMFALRRIVCEANLDHRLCDLLPHLWRCDVFQLQAPRVYA